MKPVLAVIVIGMALPGLGVAADTPTAPPLSATPPPITSPDIDDPSLLMRQAEELEKKGSLAEAYLMYLRLFQQNPSQPGLRSAMDRTTQALSARETQLRNTLKAGHVHKAQRREDHREQKLDTLEAEYKRGLAYYRKKEYLAASAVFNRVLQEAPRHAAAVKALAQTQKKIGRLLERNRFTSPPNFYAHEGHFYYNRGQWAQAAKSLEKAMAQGPLPAHLANANIPEQAIMARKRHELELWKTEREVLWNKAQDLRHHNKLQESAEILEDLLHKDSSDAPAITLYQEITTILRGKEQDVETARLRSEIAQRMRLARDTFQRGQLTEAFDHYAHVLRLDPTHKGASEEIRQVRDRLQQRGLFAPSVPTTSPAEAAYQRGLLLYGNSQIKEATQAFEEALREDPRHAQAREALNQIRKL